MVFHALQRVGNPCTQLRTLAGYLFSHIVVVTVSLGFAIGYWRGEVQGGDHSAGELPSLQGWGAVTQLPAVLSADKHNA